MPDLIAENDRILLRKQHDRPSFMVALSPRPPGACAWPQDARPVKCSNIEREEFINCRMPCKPSCAPTSKTTHGRLQEKRCQFISAKCAYADRCSTARNLSFSASLPPR